MTLDDLKTRLDSFSPAQIEFVATVAESLSNPPSKEIREPGTWLTGSDPWIEYFRLAPSLHCRAKIEPLGLNAFESVFRSACEHAGWTLDDRGSGTRRFVNLTEQPQQGRKARAHRIAGTQQD